MLMLISVLMFTWKLNSRIKFDFAMPTLGVSLAMFFDFIQLQSDQGKGEVQLKDRISVKGREGGQSWYGGLFTSYHATTMSHLLSRISHKYEIENAKLTNDIMLMHPVFFIEKEPKCLVWLRISMRKDYLIFWAGRLNGPTVSLTVRIDTSPLFVDTCTHTHTHTHS